MLGQVLVAISNDAAVLLAGLIGISVILGSLIWHVYRKGRDDPFIQEVPYESVAEEISGYIYADMKRD